MRGWPEEVIAWLRENVPGRTTKQVTELINQQGFDKKYGMVFSAVSYTHLTLPTKLEV